jgi:hypothetical protein
LADLGTSKKAIKAMDLPKSMKSMAGKNMRRLEQSGARTKAKKKYDRVLLSVENNILILLSSLIEGRIISLEDMSADQAQSEDPIATTLLGNIDTDIYMRNLDNLHQNSKGALPYETEENKFMYYALLTHLLEIDQGATEEGVKIWKVFGKWQTQEGKGELLQTMGRIEILNEQGHLEVLYFKIP